MTKMPKDYTLVIPTYNRPDQLTSLLSYLEREGADFPIHVLDSSLPGNRELNCGAIDKVAGLDIEYREYGEDTHPFDKFLDGVGQVGTAYCQLCADDDLIFIDGIDRALRVLGSSPDYHCAHGYYFMFMQDQHDAMDIPFILYFSPTNDDGDPLVRLRNQFRNYQALTYGVYRTATLREILEAVSGVSATLSKELLSGALTVVKGKTKRLNCFTHGRNMGPSEAYTRWHPLEWLFRDPANLFEEYIRYRDIIVTQVGRETGRRPRREISEIVDLVHLHYLIRHAPTETYEYMLDQAIAGKTIDEYWRDSEVQIPLSRVPYIAPDGRMDETSAGRGVRYLDSRLKSLYRRLGAHFGSVCHESHERVETRSTEIRDYRLHPDFLVPSTVKGIRYDRSEIDRIIKSMDNYRRDAA
jgi:glycosyltransferase domain-containing protein